LDSLLHEVRPDGVAVVTLNRPDRRNAMTLAMWQGLPPILAALAARRDVRALVLTGAGAHFCSGAELSQYGAGPAEAGEVGAAVEACSAALTAWPRPTVAAVSGFCMAGGLLLATACDFRVADGTARFGVPVARLGNTYPMGACATLVRAVGVQVAKDLLFTARLIDCAEARRVGLVDREAQPALDGALGLLGPMIDKAPASLAAAKLALNAVAAGEADRHAAALHALAAAAVASDDFREGIRAFTERRAPRFTGDQKRKAADSAR